MKAREILNLCEDNQLSAEELYNSIVQYSKKRFSPLGFQKSASGWRSEIALAIDSISDSQLQHKKLFQYAKELSKFLGRGRKLSKWGYEFNLTLEDNLSQSSISIFYLEIYANTNNSLHIVVCYSEKIDRLRFNHLVQDGTNAKTVELVGSRLGEVYALIDLAAKAVRLTPVE